MRKHTVQHSPFIVPTSDGKVINEHFGLATNGNTDLSIAHMIAPPGWSEPFQTPKFDEYTFIIKGKKQFIIDGETFILEESQSIKTEKKTKVQYSNPFTDVCEYIAVCKPDFSMELVNREE